MLSKIKASVPKKYLLPATNNSRCPNKIQTASPVAVIKMGASDQQKYKRKMYNGIQESHRVAEENDSNMHHGCTIFFCNNKKGCTHFLKLLVCLGEKSKYGH